MVTAFSGVEQSDGLVAIESHNFFDAVPVGFVELKVAQSGSWFKTHHTLSAQRGMTAGPCSHLILTRIQHAPVITSLT